jgi:gephyrin
VLAEDVRNPEPQPPFPASIMDGYAVVASDGPGTYPVVGRITAGVDPDEKGARPCRRDKNLLGGGIPADGNARTAWPWAWMVRNAVVRCVLL